MHKRTVILLIVLGVLALSLLFFAVFLKKNNSRQVLQPKNDLILTSVEKTVKVSFDPQELSVKRFSSSSATNVQILVDTGKNSVSGVQLELLFDPKAFLSFDIIPAQDSILGKIDKDYVVMSENVNLANGSASFIAGIGTNNNIPRTGNGAVAVITFQVNPSFTGDSTPITFIKTKSFVTQKNVKESVLSSLTPLIINIE